MKYKDLLRVGLALATLIVVSDADARSSKHKNELEVQTALTIEMEDFKEFQLDDAYPTPPPAEDKTVKTNSKPDVTLLPEFDPKSVSRNGNVVFKGDPRCAAHPECCVNRRGIGFVIASLAKCGVSNYVEHPSLNLKAVPDIVPPESSASNLQVMPYNALTEPDQI